MVYRGEKSIVVLSSADRISGTPEDFNVNLKLPSNNRYNRCAVLQASIPKSYYSIPELFRSFNLIEFDVSKKLTIPSGNYSRSSFKNVLQTLLNAESQNGWAYTVSFDPTTSVDTGKYTFTVSGNSSNQPSFVMPDNTYVSNVFGLTKNTTNTFQDNTLVSTKTISFQSHDQLIIRSSLVSDSQGNILQEIISSTSPYQGVIEYSCNDIFMNSRVIRLSPTGSVGFSLGNIQGEKIDLNGSDWSLSLILYEKDDINEHHRRDMALRALESIDPRNS